MRNQILASMGLTLILMQPALAQSADQGRSNSWRTAAQGAPSLKTTKKLVEKNPDDPVALNDYGFALRQNGNLEEAEKYLLMAVKKDPKMGQAHCNLSVVFYDRGKTEKSVEAAREAVRLDADHAVYRVVLGNALSKSGDLKAAEQEYRVAIKLKPEYENARYHLGRLLTEMGRDNDARFELAQALELDPKDDRVLALLDKLEKKGTSAEPARKVGEKTP